MKRTVERIGPFVPAFATAGASVCVSALLLATGPQTLGPQTVVPPLTTEAGRIVVALSPPRKISPGGPSPVARSADRRSLSSPARGAAPPASASHRPSTQTNPVGAWSPPPRSPASPAPPATGPTPSAPAVQASTGKAKPGWGYGDPNHDHTGPPGKKANGKKNQAAPPGAGPPTPADAQHGSGGKKSTGPPPKGTNDRKDQATPTAAAPPTAAGAEHGSVQNGEKKSTGG
jgi:hypothetical protein